MVRTTTASSVVTAMDTWNVHQHGVAAVERFLHGSWLRPGEHAEWGVVVAMMSEIQQQQHNRSEFIRVARGTRE